MKIYQLMAHGNLTAFENSYKVHSKEVYKTEEQARKAMPKFSNMVTTPRTEYDLMTLDKKGLEITILCLNLVNNGKGGKRK